MTMSKVLVVGGAGYVGSVLVEELLARGYAVRILDRLYFGDEGLADVRDRVELTVGDMRQASAELFDGVDAVLNLGGLSNDPTAEYNPKANHEMNTVATRRLAELAKQQGVPRYVLASSCSIYDQGVGGEADSVVLDEDSPVAPRAAYSRSKLAAEEAIRELADERFCPVILRKGTIFGFSRRMRYDLVVNTFVRDALAKGVLTLHYGGEMWRPLVNVRDAARAYIACLEADTALVHAQTFNVSLQNMRISELALRVREALRGRGFEVDVKPDYGYCGVRSYRVSAGKIERVLGLRPKVTIEESVLDLVDQIRSHGYTDFDNPRYYNIKWMQFLEGAQALIKLTDTLF
jgi:nucleoside-diphosphate-sugar epimerase